jgi:predicted dehydrogenase
MAVLPVLLVGCGRWGRNILRDLCALDRPVIVVDSSPEARCAAAPLACAAQSSFEVREPISGAIIATPASHHAEAIERVAPLGKPIFVEKPLACRIEDAERAFAVAGSRLFVMDKWRYHPGIEALASLAASGELGPVRALRTCRLGWGHAHDDVDPIWTLLPHDLAIVREIFGHLPPALEAVAERAAGRVWGMSARLGPDSPCALEVSARRPEHRRRIEVAFDGACAVLDGARDDAIEIRSDAGSRMVEVSREPPLKRELAAFVAHLDGGPAPKSSARDGVDSVRRICELRELAGLDA